MERGSWREISKDPEIWKKLALGSVYFLTVLPIPIALGALNTDLEDELKNIKGDKPPGKLADLDDFLTSFGRGLAPVFIFFLAMMLYCVPTIVVLMSSAQTYAWLKSEHGMNYLSFCVTSLFGLLALVVQFLCTAIFPVALAQYARGMNIKPAVDPMANLGYVFSMGAPYWAKVSGYWIFLLGSMVLFIQGINFWVDLPIRFLLSGLGFASLVVSSRYALGQLQTKL
jgi:Protein of unknown function (DUF4013)